MEGGYGRRLWGEVMGGSCGGEVMREVRGGGYRGRL